MIGIPLQAGFDVLGDGRPETVWLALGTILMLAGTLYFIARGWGVTDERAREYYSITILIPAIATAAYLSMFFGYGLAEIPVEGRGVLDIYWARYADWLFTTPLLLLDLALLAGADRTTIGTLVSIDALMIVTGAVGALSGTPLERYVWWLVSTIAFVFLLYFLVKNLREAATDKSDEVRSTFTTLTILVVVLWSAYPVWWLIGTEGAGVVGLGVETLGFAFLDVTAKVGFGFILLRSRAIMGPSEVPDDAPEVAESTAVDSRRTGTFEIFEDQAGEWRWRLRAGNWRIIADSGEGYASKQGARRAVENARERLEEGDYLDLQPTGFEVYRDKADEWRWRMLHRNGNVLADSGEGYSSRSAARDAVQRFRRNIGNAEIQQE